MIKDGILNINKPEGWTSQDVCAKLKGRLYRKKTGHTGTLDPMATGVLPVCIGKATRVIQYYDRDKKSYHAGMRLGITTDTLDITGEITQEKPFGHVTEDEILRAFSAYRGKVSQIPPKYSALKINGKRAYDLAREGKDVQIKPRKIEIFSNNVTCIDAESGIIEFDVVCSKGTYIRTICDDIGRSLGCGACMSSLVRTGTGYFRIKDAYELSVILEMTDEELEKCIIDPDVTLEKLGIIHINDNRIIAFTNGSSTSARTYKVNQETDFDNFYRVYGNGSFLGTGRIKDGELFPDKILI